MRFAVSAVAVAAVFISAATPASADDCVFPISERGSRVTIHPDAPLLLKFDRPVAMRLVPEQGFTVVLVDNGATAIVTASAIARSVLRLGVVRHLADAASVLCPRLERPTDKVPRSKASNWWMLASDGVRYCFEFFDPRDRAEVTVCLPTEPACKARRAELKDSYAVTQCRQQAPKRIRAAWWPFG